MVDRIIRFKMSRVVGCNKVIRSSANSSIGEEVDRLLWVEIK